MKTINILIISLAIAVSFAGCQKDEFSLDILDDIDYEIYSLILDERFPDVRFPNIEFTVRQETTLWVEINLNSAFEYLNSLADVDTSVFIDYILKNEEVMKKLMHIAVLSSVNYDALSQIIDSSDEKLDAELKALEVDLIKEG